MRCRLIILGLAGVLTAPAAADLRELVPEEAVRLIAAETSGEAAKRNLDALTLHHRMRAGEQFDRATDHILRVLQRYGLDEVEVLTYPADGETMFGTQKSRPAWRVRSAELWEVAEGGDRVRRLADWDSVPLSLAQDSLSGEVTTSLVDIGAGTSDADFAGNDLAGKLVLTSSQPEAVIERAVGDLGAAGILSYAPNQKSAWWKEDSRLVRWGHLGSFPKTESFAFMMSLGEARKLQQRLDAGEEIRFHASVDASHEVGTYRFATAAIRGAEKPDEEIHFTCHLDHPRPGANDNASGCAAILEVARTLNVLVKRGLLPRPARSIRFLWPAEIEGSIMYLVEHDDPSRIKANIHMDMVGGGPETKARYRISGGPMSLPSFVADLGHEIGRFVNRETQAFTDGAETEFPLNAHEGGMEPLAALMEGLSMGSDHDVFFGSTWSIPGIYLHDWPDRYIHTNFDSAANVDPTKLKRSAFIGAVAAWFLATMDEQRVPAVLEMLRRNALARSSNLLDQRSGLSEEDRIAASKVFFEVERRKVESIENFADLSDYQRSEAKAFGLQLESMIGFPHENLAPPARPDGPVYARNPAIQGPMWAFGYSYLEDKYGEDEVKTLRLLSYTGERGAGRQYAYEALNLIDGKRTVADIRGWLTAELGPVPIEYVAEYLRALESIDVIRQANPGL